jgi:hypothetical protein
MSPPQPSWRIRAMMSRKLRSRHRACASLTIVLTHPLGVLMLAH